MHDSAVCNHRAFVSAVACSRKISRQIQSGILISPEPYFSNGFVSPFWPYPNHRPRRQSHQPQQKLLLSIRRSLQRSWIWDPPQSSSDRAAPSRDSGTGSPRRSTNHPQSARSSLPCIATGRRSLPPPPPPRAPPIRRRTRLGVRRLGAEDGIDVPPAIVYNPSF